MIGSIGPGHPAAVARPDPVRRRCATTTSSRSTGSSRAASTCCSSRPSTTCSRPRPRSTARARAMRARGRRSLPIMVQVTVETTGRMLVGTEIGAALTALEAMQPDVIGMNCATGPAEMTEHLRYLAQHARTFLSALPNAGLPSVVDGHTHYDLTPDAARRGARALRAPSSASTSSAVAAAPRPSTCAQVVERLGTTARRSLRTPEFEPGCSSIYSHVPFHQELAYLAVGERTNANGSRKFRDAMLEADWDTCVQMAREQVKEGAHVLDVCVDYVGRDGTDRHGRDRGPLRDPGVAAARVRLDRAAGARSRPAAPRRQGAPQLGQPRRGRGRGQAHGPRVPPRARVRRGRHLPHDRRRGPGAHRRLEDARREAHLRHRDRALRPRTDRPDLRRAHVPALDRRRRPPPRRDGDDRGDPPHQGRAARARRPILGLSNVSFGLKPAARHVLNSVFLHECREAGPRRRDRARGAHHAAAPRSTTRQREVALDLIYDRRRETTTRSPSSWRCSRTSKPARSRRKTARAGRSRSG